MADIIESRIEFHFDDHFWTSLKKVDNSADHVKVQVLPKTKAVDFAAFFGNNLMLIEVKNLRGHRIENAHRTTNSGEVIVTEVGLKVRDSLATIIGGARNSTNDKATWLAYGKHLVESKPLKIVLWIEEDNPSSKREKAGLSVYTNNLKTKLKWLTGGGNHVLVLDSTSNDLDGLTVTLLPN